MQQQAKQFLDLLESHQLLSPDVLNELRRQVAESKARLTTELLAKLLVDNGHLTKFQATKLITEIKESNSAGVSAASEDEEELGFADEAPGRRANSRKAGPQAATVIVDEDDLDDDDLVDVVEVVEAEPVEVVEVVAVEPVTTTAAAEDLNSGPLPPPKRIVPTKKSSANPYDSFRILGVGLLLALVLIAGFFLVNYFWRGSAEDRLKLADDSYQQRSYETAAVMYKEFADVFPSNENASYAKVRAALAAIRKDAEGAPDPTVGLKTAQRVLPAVASESAMAAQQSDLAGALIALAGKFNARADRTTDTSERKVLMEQMAELLQLIDNPQYVGTHQKNQQAPTLARIGEDRERILREIYRDEALVTALGEIDKKLATKDTLAAYQIRKQLINNYPLLEVDAGLAERVQQASQIQRELVQPGDLEVKLSKTQPAQVVGRSFVLAHRSGSQAASLKGHTLFVKGKGSVYGIDGASGEILWRQFVGSEFNSEPLRLGNSQKADAIICQPEQGRLARLNGSSGEPAWWASLGKPIHNPALESDDLFVATFDGSVASLDSGGGQLKWSTKLPQAAATTPGTAFGQPMLYIAAENSNLYVLSRDDGSCQEVFYLGHRPGSIVVPPIPLLGQLFVFENLTASTTKIRILSMGDSGLQLQDAQTAITMEGNVVVPPQIDGRHLIVQTDLGQIKILDIEPTVEKEKVSELVTVPKNVFSPKQSWLLADHNRVWVVDNQLTRFDLQLATLKMSRAWIKNDGDRFIGPPQRFDNVLIHSRVLRGNQGIRVSAVEADSANVLWETDLGIPITHIGASDAGYAAVNTSAMLFALGNTPIRNQADSNPMQGKSAALFSDPTRLSDGRVVLLNRSRGNQLAVYDPGRKVVDQLLANFGSAQPASNLVAVENKVVLGLDNGQLVMLNVSNGALAGAPYQPAMEAGKKVRWNTPVYLPQSQSMIVASDLQKLVRLGVGDDLRSLNEVDLRHPLVGPLVVVGNQVGAVASTPGGDAFQLFDANSLKSGSSLQLPGRLVAGPFPLPDDSSACMLQTDSQLVKIAPEGQIQWSIDFPQSALVGPPVASKANLIVVTRNGDIWNIAADSGEVVGRASAGQSLASQPLVASTNLLVGSDEGAVLALPIPTQTAESTQ